MKEAFQQRSCQHATVRVPLFCPFFGVAKRGVLLTRSLLYRYKRGGTVYFHCLAEGDSIKLTEIASFVSIIAR